MINIKLTKIEAKRVQEALYWYKTNGGENRLFARTSGVVTTCVNVMKKIEKASKPKTLVDCGKCSACKVNESRKGFGLMTCFNKKEVFDE